MEEIMSLAQIMERFQDEWVLIEYDELDEDLGVLCGQVVAHSPDRDEIYRQILALKGKKLAVEYAGEVPQDLAVVL